jgi:hypothetical protein
MTTTPEPVVIDSSGPVAGAIPNFTRISTEVMRNESYGVRRAKWQEQSILMLETVGHYLIIKFAMMYSSLAIIIVGKAAQYGENWGMAFVL